MNRKNMILSNEGAMQFSQALHTLNNSLLEFIKIAEEMVPEDLIKHGLKDFISEFCKEIELENNISISLSFSDVFPKQDLDFETQIYRITKALISYSLKSTLTPEIHIKFQQQDNIFAFHLQEKNTNFHHTDDNALKNIKSLIDALDGKSPHLSDQNEKTYEIQAEFKMPFVTKTK